MRASAREFCCGSAWGFIRSWVVILACSLNSFCGASRFVDVVGLPGITRALMRGTESGVGSACGVVGVDCNCWWGA